MITKTPLFSGSIDEWNTYQQQFVSWCVFYYNIGQMDEPPSPHLIESDLELDNFLRAREVKIKHDKIKSDAHLKKTAAGSGSHTHEVFK